jgi:hypothetical protein
MLGCIVIIEAFAATPASRKVFDVPAGPAESTLRVLATQADVELVYSIDKIDGVRTNAVKGEGRFTLPHVHSS